MKNNHFQRQLTNKAWFMRVISLFCAIFLYAFVAAENNNFPGQRPDNASVNVTETVSNVPVQLGKVANDVFVSNLQESVTVKITGPRNIVNQVLAQDLYVVTEDLTQFDMGRQQVRLEMPESLKQTGVDYQITPTRVIVDLDRIATKEVGLEFILGDNLVANGYEITDIKLNPVSVILKGKESTIEKIARAYVRIVSNQPLTKSIKRSYKIEIRDADNNLLDLNPNVTEAEVTVEIGKEKTEATPIVLETTGEQKERFTYQYQIEGPQSLNLRGVDPAVDHVVAHLDVSQITQSGSYPATLQVPSGAEGSIPTQIQVQVTVTPVAHQESSERSNNAGQPAEEDKTESINHNGDHTESQPTEQG